MRELPTGTVTFLFTDIERSTRLLHELGSAYADALTEHRRVLRQAFGAHGGIEVDTQGDAFFVAFARASDALAAAMEAQLLLAEGPVRVRMALHTGEPLVTEEGYVGLDVHRAARIASAGHGGQILLSQPTRDLVDAAVRDLGLHRLKDLLGPERIYQLGREEFPLLKSLNQTNLPVQPTSFLGRHRELDEVLALLRRQDVRQLTLTGSGGSGKTRLALQAAAELVEYYEGGVWWVPLAPLRDPALVLEAVAQTLGAKTDLGDHIRDQHLLLLLDNFEQVAEAAPEVGRLLVECAGLEVLATSRQPLHVSGEREYPVLPLVESDAVSLFVERAQASRPDFATDAHVAEICRRLDCLPLAVELAAVRVKALSPEAILQRLDRRLPLLIGGPRDLPERQRTLRATIEWSYELLTTEEQRVFVRLAVFVGGCALEAAEAICEADLEVLTSLIDKSLVSTAGERYVTLETVREFALERLAESGDADDLRRRHADYFVALAEKAAPDLRAARQAEWLKRLELEHDNVRAALDWADLVGDAELELRLVAALWVFWLMHGHLREGRARLEATLGREVDEQEALHATALEGLSVITRAEGDYERAEKLAEESLTVWRAVGDRDAIARALSDFGMAAVTVGDYSRARAILEEGLALAQEVGETSSIALATRFLGDLALHERDYRRAEPLLRESLALEQRLGDKHGVAASLFGLGLGALQGGEREKAEHLIAESIRVGRETANVRNVVWCLDVLGALAAARGDDERAARMLSATEALLQSIGGSLPAHLRRDAHDPSARLLSRRMSEDALARARREGEAMSLDAAVAYALGADPVTRVSSDRSL